MNSRYIINKELGKFIDTQNNKEYELYNGHRLLEPLTDEIRKDLINDSTCFDHLPLVGGDVQTKCPEYNRNLCFGDDNTEFEVYYDKKVNSYYLLVKNHIWFGCEEYTDIYKYQLPYLNGYKECLCFNAYQEYDCVNIYNNGFFVLSLGSYKQVMQNVENNTELTPIYDYSVIQGGLRG